MRRRGLGRRGGLLGAAARTAVIAGTATAVSNKVSRHQHGGDQEAARSAGGGNPDRITQLERLNELKKSGALSAEEFEREKAKLPH